MTKHQFSINKCIYPPQFISIYLSIYLSQSDLSIYPSLIYLSIYPSLIYLSIYLFIYLGLFPSIQPYGVCGG